MTTTTLDQRELSLLPAWLQRVEERLNPLLVKELRQSLRGKAFAWTFFWALFIVALATGIWAISQVTVSGTPSGATLLGIIGAMLLFVSNLFVPLHAFQSMVSEHRGSGRELLALTGLSPWRIALGKWLASMTLMLLFLFAAAPFLTMAFLLEGVDVTHVLAALFWPLRLAMVFGALGLALGAAAKTQATRLPLTGFLLIAALYPMFQTAVFARMTGVGTFGAMFVGAGFGATMAMLLVQVATGIGAAATGCACAASLLAYPVENRSTGPRLAMAAWIAVSLAGLSIMQWMGGSPFAMPLAAFMQTQLMALVVILVFAVTEKVGRGQAGLGSAPHMPLMRAVAAPFLPGANRAFLWGLCMLALLMIGGFLIEFAHGSGAGTGTSAIFVGVVVLVWVLLPAALMRMKNPNPTHPIRERVFLIILPFATMILPPLAIMLLGGRESMDHPLSLFAVLSEDSPGDHYKFFPGRQFGVTSVLAFAGLLLSALLASRGLREVLALPSTLPKTDLEGT